MDRNKYRYKGRKRNDRRFYSPSNSNRLRRDVDVYDEKDRKYGELNEILDDKYDVSLLYSKIRNVFKIENSIKNFNFLDQN